MMHDRRIFRVSDTYKGEALSPSTLARALTLHSWTLCTGFRLRSADGSRSLVFLCDATSEDGAAEYAVFDEGLQKQIESLTCSWMKTDELANVIERLLAEGGCPPWGGMPSLKHPEGSCYRCA